MSGNTATEELIGQLNSKASSKRRSAAKKLRKLKAKNAGPNLLAALRNELKDKRTWETQYQMIMALGESGYTESLDYLHHLAKHDFEATMVYVAIGDAINRLTYLKDGSISQALNLLGNGNNTTFLVDGLIRAIAIRKLIPSDQDIVRIINYGNRPEVSDNNRTWIASAAAGWDGTDVEQFLHRCAASDHLQTKKAAEAALNKQYPKWDIL